MDLIRILLSRCLALLRRRKLDEDLQEELRTHMDLAAEEYLKRGMPEEVARTKALREFGGVTQTKERYRVQRDLTFLEVLGQDVSFGLRQMRRSPGYSAVCLLTLCLGIGVNAAVFSVIQAVILRPLPYHDANRLMHLADPQDQQDGGILYKDFASLREQSQSSSGMAVYYRDSGWSRVTLTGAQDAEFVQGAFVSADFFPLLGMSTALGRVLSPEEEFRHERVVVLSYSLWQRRFAGSPAIVGQKIKLDGGTSEVIGVMPESFQFPARDSQFWAPITTNRYWGDPSLNSNDGSHARGFYARWQAIGRLKEHISQKEAQAELNTIFRRLEKADPDSNRGTGMEVVPLRVEVNGNTRLALYVLFAAVSLLLFIACINVATLLWARGVSRAHEMALRTALGASRGRILQQSLTEAALLAALAGVLSLPAGYLGTRAFIALGPPDIPRLQETGLNSGMFGFGVAVVLLCLAILGAAHAARNLRADPAKEMRSRVP
jgi:predicted permease